MRDERIFPQLSQFGLDVLLSNNGICTRRRRKGRRKGKSRGRRRKGKTRRRRRSRGKRRRRSPSCGREKERKENIEGGEKEGGKCGGRRE